MRRLSSIHWAVLFTVTRLAAACATTPPPEPTKALLVSSATLDPAELEQAIERYNFELATTEAFAERVDWSKYFEDLTTKQRINFASFGGLQDASCQVAMPADAFSYLKAHPRQALTVKLGPPGRTVSMHHSQLNFSFPMGDKRGEFNAQCSQSQRRMTIADLAHALVPLVSIRAKGDDAPQFHVCCRCQVEVFGGTGAAGDSVVTKAAPRTVSIPRSTDSVCQRRIEGQRYQLNPGHKSFSPSEPRYSLWKQCEAVQPGLCGMTREQATKAAVPAVEKTPKSKK